MVTCGPYSFSDSLSYTPLEVLIQSVRLNNPDVLLMMGPFVDQNNQLLSSGLFTINGDALGYHQL